MELFFLGTIFGSVCSMMFMGVLALVASGKRRKFVCDEISEEAG